MNQEIIIHITIGKRLARLSMALALVLAIPLEIGSETLTLTASYPSPSGIYNAIIATGNGPGNNNSILNRSGGNTLLAPNGTNTAGNVGVGTTAPGQKLDVAGNINTSGNFSASGSIAAAGSAVALQNMTAGQGVSSPLFTASQGYIAQDRNTGPNPGSTMFYRQSGENYLWVSDNNSNIIQYDASGQTVTGAVTVNNGNINIPGVINTEGSGYLNGCTYSTSEYLVGGPNAYCPTNNYVLWSTDGNQNYQGNVAASGYLLCCPISDGSISVPPPPAPPPPAPAPAPTPAPAPAPAPAPSCVATGGSCTSASQCCSGLCGGWTATCD